MIEKERFTEKECSRKLAISAFNETWNYLSKKERNKEENEKCCSLPIRLFFIGVRLVQPLTLKGVNGCFHAFTQ